MGVVPHLKAPTKGESLQRPACAASVFFDVLAMRKTRLVSRSGRLHRFLSVQREAFVKGYFRTPVWCTGANLQRLVGCLYHRWLPRVNYRRELLVLSDRGLVALDWLNEDRPASQTRPWRSLLPALAAVGFPGLVRLCRGGEQGAQPYPRECLSAAGVSLGVLVLSLYLCQRGPPAQMDAALAVSPPFQPAVAARPLSNSWGCSLLPNACITRRLVGRLRDNEEVVRVAKGIRADDVFRCWTLASFDHHYMPPRHSSSNPCRTFTGTAAPRAGCEKCSDRSSSSDRRTTR
ncbi:hypothetical protein V5799_023643 [Amblyomma americanum]|uniref:Uncharacterized protein n=1 Tax=Amblyomma americanum TaxID=6943 RepID=A0AAQ4FJ24_AMBAM